MALIPVLRQPLRLSLPHNPAHRELFLLWSEFVCHQGGVFDSADPQNALVWPSEANTIHPCTASRVKVVRHGVT